MLVKRRVGPKGQIVIPKQVRDELGIESGSTVAIDVEDGKVVITAYPTGSKVLEDYLGVVRDKLARAVDYKKLVEEELAERLQVSR